MTDVVGKARSVDDIRIEPQTGGELTADLSNLERMSEAIAGESRPIAGLNTCVLAASLRSALE